MNSKFATAVVLFIAALGISWLSSVEQDISLPLLGLKIPASSSPYIIALAVVLTLYLFLALSRRNACTSKATEEGLWGWLNPAVVSSGEYGVTSISSLQLLWFTLIVVFGVVVDLFSNKGLSVLSPDVLPLLGVPAASKVTSALISKERLRLSSENWNWLVENNFLLDGRQIDPRTSAGWKDVLLTDGVFDPVRFQLFTFSFVIGWAIILGGDIESFKIGSWNIFLTGSNVFYLGGKALSQLSVDDLDSKVNELRKNKPASVTKEEKHFLGSSIEALYGRNALGEVYTKN
jgi:hypothetical protein